MKISQKYEFGCNHREYYRRPKGAVKCSPDEQ